LPHEDDTSMKDNEFYTYFWLLICSPTMYLIVFIYFGQI
jgi:hypothetical protein